MAVYTVHIPQGRWGERPTPERIVFLRDGFSLAAFALGPLWLLWRRAWLPAALWTVLLVAIGALAAAGLSPEAASALEIALGVLLGLEGSRLVAWSLARRGFSESAVIVAESLSEAEEAFFGSLQPSGVSAGGSAAGGAAATRPAIGGLFEELRP
ncbi:MULTISPECIES: DUF2628 domain-containing protein [Methylosinus]|uniref:DUF2628 domain-containing protein n=1 Tax=Methylosinus trichosporium (strain ATCC 35070 / NCIMB 11131 / UNIQEM 75 / OB3b) TaxID=595536 RepID=A0A2D2CYJ5_METT3|nr:MULTISPECIES: DUF2628 domain-containing protein [Methylosinus]ATQ67774.1 DUF2628 domain-containing protein [Methylosinus trichosporium OB3b]OBS51793.1 hypothetical protein A8B73_14110 [Methylosinus sp. 3S-1]